MYVSWNVYLNRYLRCLLVGFGLIFSSSAFAAWINNGATKCNLNDPPVSNCAAYVNPDSIWRLASWSSTINPATI